MGTITRSFANNITSGGTFDATDLTGTIPSSNIADASVTNITAVPALTSVSTVASDPPSPDAGQIWYNTTDKALRAYILGAGSWATGGNLNQFRDQTAGSGTQTSTLVFGGGPPNIANTESYNGSAWTEVNDLNLARRGIAGAGADNTSALAFGGGSAPVYGQTETWNGTSWTEVNDLNTARYFTGGTGIITAALCFGGNLDPGNTAVTESWNGTSWTEVNDLNSAKNGLGSAGVQSSALAFGGSAPVTGATESWNGTSWTEVNDLNTARVGVGGTGTSNTSALAFGGGVINPGAPPPTVSSGVTEEWNGTSWTEVADLATSRAYIAGSGTKIAALASGGSDNTNTEEWTKANVTTDLGVS